MTPSRRHFLLYGLRATAIMFAAVVGADARAGDAAASLVVGEPDGFAALTAPRRLVVDVYSGGQQMGETQVLVAPGTVTFVDPGSVIAMIPSLKEKTAVHALLATEALPANGQLVCTEHADKNRCGRLAPEVAGVIFDAGRFRLDLFVNPKLLSIDHDLGSGLIDPARR